MGKKKGMVPLEPEDGLPLIDVHCHVPWTSKKKGRIDNEIQYRQFIENNGKIMITSTIDWESMEVTLKFLEGKNRAFLAAGWAPQTVTFTSKNIHTENFMKWKQWIKNNPNKYVAIGEIGLDFHHAKKLSERKRQIKYFKEILRYTKNFGKPYQLHVRNPSKNDKDPKQPNHPYNEEDAANHIVVKIIEEENILPEHVMWHCFSGPKEWGEQLAEKGYNLSAVSSSYRSKRWRSNTKNAPLNKILTETDGPFQHPTSFRGFNTPTNVKYSVAAVAYSHNTNQKKVAESVLSNAKTLYGL